MMQSDPGSLDRLHDIVTAPSVSWWPPAPAWYVVLALLAVAVLGLIFYRWRRWKANAYRREALACCQKIMTESQTNQRAAQLAEILKRTALTAYPRAEVASLTSDTWLQFLDHSARNTAFTQSTAGRWLVEGTYNPHTSSSNDVANAAYDQVCLWIRHHVREDQLPTGASC